MQQLVDLVQILVAISRVGCCDGARDSKTGEVGGSHSCSLVHFRVLVCLLLNVNNALCLRLYVTTGVCSLTGLLDSIAGSTLQITAVPLALTLTTNSDALSRMVGRGAPENNRPWFMATMVYGIVFTVLVLISACYNIAMTRYVPVGNETFWCDLAG